MLNKFYAKMRKSYLYSILVALLLIPSACDFLDKEPDTELTLEMVFEDKTKLYGWLANAYSAIPDPYMGHGRYLGWDILGDDMTPSERWRQWNWKVIPYILGEWTPNSEWDGNYWALLPQRIREINIFLRDAHALPDQGVSNQEIEYMRWECRALRAYYYSLLVNTYGAIPFEPEKITETSAAISEMTTGQVPYYTVVDWCDRELLEASKNLPALYSSAQKYGRFTSVMALAIRARMLLYAASPLVNGNTDYAGYTNDKGEIIFSQTYNPDRWVSAAAASKLLIETAEAAGYKLFTMQNKSGNDDPFLSLQYMLLTQYNEGNTEILFARPNGCDYTEYEKHITPSNSGGSGGWGITQSLVDAFFMENGLPITDAESHYEASGFEESAITRDDTEWDELINGGAVTQAHTYKMYCHREPRFYITVSFHNSWFTQEERAYQFLNGQSDNPHTHDAPQNGYLVRKKVHPKTNVKEGNFQYRPGVLYRLGEAYLNYAEALNECDPGNVEILTYLNKIRVRAGVRPYTNGATTSNEIHVDMSQNAMRETIRHERRVELCCEGLRYDDLRRWKMAESALNGPFYGMNFSGATETNFFQLTAYQTRVYRKSFYWFPIHQNEIDKNTNLRQLPNW